MNRINPIFLRGVDVSPDNVAGENRPLSRLCDVTDWDSPAFNQFACDILDLGESKEAPKHRKLWEFTSCIRALDHYGLLNPSAVGLSVAAGYERILYYLARKVDLMVATDIYGEGSFAYREATKEAMFSPEKFAPYPYPHGNLKFLFMDALKLDFRDSTFDFCICLSSIEHFGGVKKAATAIEQMARVVRPGGLIVITTECSLNGKKTPDVFSISEIHYFIKQSGLELADGLYLSLTKSSIEHLIDMRHENTDLLPHINIRAYGTDFTSICIALRKKGEQFISSDYLRDRRVYLHNFEQVQTEPISIDHRGYYFLIICIKRAMTFVSLRLQEWLSIETWYLKFATKK